MATTLLTVTGNPSTYTAGNWPDTVMNGGLWRFTFTTAGSSASGTYSPFCAFFCGPVIGGTSGGLWIEQNLLELYDTSDNLVFSQPMTFGAGQTLTFTINVPSLTVTIAGATTGNGTFSFSNSGPYFFAGTTLTAGGVTGQSGFEIAGTIGDIDDAGTGSTIACASGAFALSGTDAALVAVATISAASGTFTLTGTAASLTPSATGATITCDSGAFALTGTAATLTQNAKITASAGAFAFTGSDASLTSGIALRVGAHGVDFQDFGFANRAASVTLTTQASGSVVVMAAGGHSAEVTQAWTDSKNGNLRKLTAVVDYPDFPGYGTQIGITPNPMTGGASHAFGLPVAASDENTTFATEVIGGRRISTVNTNVANAGAGTTQTSATLVADGPAVLIADWWGSSPVVPPFSGSPSIGAPFTATPNNGFVVLDSYLVNNEFGEVQGSRAALTVTAAGSYSVTWTHSPAQGAQLWLSAVQIAATFECESGSFALAGQDADITATGHASISCDSGSFALAGSDAALLAGAIVSAGSGAFVLAGSAATLRADAVLLASAGSLALTGTDASLVAAARVAASPGAFLLTGTDATLRAVAAIVADAGTFTLTGGSASLVSSTEASFDAESGSFTVSGGDMVIRAGATIGAGSGAFLVSGTPARVLGDPIADMEDAIYRWVVAGSGLASTQVIWASAGGGGPQPTGLYISMRLIGIDSVSDDWIISRTVGSTVVRHVRGTRNPTLELRCFAGSSTGALRAEMVLARVTASILLPSVAKILRAGDVGIGEIGKIRVVSGSRSTMFDPLALVEVTLHTTIDVSEVGTTIESVEVDITPPGVVLTAQRPA